MGKRLVLPVLALLASLCLPGAPAARVAPLGNPLPRLDQPRPDAPTGRSRARLFRLFPVLALLCGLHLLAAAPAAAQVTPPSVPQNVTVTPGDDQLTLTWQAPSSWGTWSASSFWIQWKDSAAAATKWSKVRANGVTNGFTDSVSATSVVFADIQADADASEFVINNGDSIDLRIAAESKDPNQDGSDSSHYRYSSWVTVSGQVVGVPAAISSSALTVTPGNAKLDLSWTAPANNGSAISGYDVHYTSAVVDTVANDAAVQTVSAAAGWLAVSRSGTTASQSITSLTINTAYRVRVRAKNTHGNGAWVFSSGTPTPLAAPTNLTVTPGPVVLNLSWTAPSGTVTGYDVHYTRATADAVTNGAAVLTGGSASSTDGWVAASRTATDTTASHRIVGADVGRTTRVRVRAKNSSGVGAWAFSSGRANELGPPTNLIVTPGNGQLTLTWTKPDGDLSRYEMEYTSAPRTGNGAVADDAMRGNDPTSAWVATRTDPAAGATSHTITGLTNGRTYRLRLRAVSQYIGDSSDALATGTPSSNLPTGLMLTPGDRSLTARWTAPASVDVVRYEVQSKLMSAANWPNTDTDVTGTSHTFTGLAAGETYQVRVRSVKREEGVSSAGRWTDPAQATLAPAAPTGLMVTPGNARLRVSWTAPSGTVTGYDVHYTSALVGSVADDAAISGNDPSAAWIDANHSGTGAMLTISGLTNSTEYRVRVRAENDSVEKSAWTHGSGTPIPTTVSLSVSSASVTEGSPVTVTATLSATQTSATVIPLTLTSGAGTDDADYGTLASITIAANAESATGEITTAQDTDAEDETFTVALGTLPAGFGAGARASIEVTILDDDKPPKAPESLNVSGRNSRLELTWAQPDEDGTDLVAAVSGYEVHYTSASVGTVANDAAASGNDASAAWVDAGHTGTDKTLTIPDLTNGTEYRVRVRADNGKVERSAWTHGMGTPVAPMVSLSVEPLEVDEGDSVKVTVTLTEGLTVDAAIPLELTNDTAEDGDYGTLVSIKVAAGALSASGAISAEQDADAEDETFTVALGATLPSPAVADASASSAQVTIVDDDKPPLAPTDLVVTPGNEQLALGWKQPADERAEVAAVSGYDVHYTSATVQAVAQDSNALGEDASLVWTDAGHVGTEHEHMITELVNNTLYRVRVRADNGKGKSEWLHGKGMPSGDSEEAAVLKLSLEALTGSIMGSAVSTVSERVESSDQPSQPLADDTDGSSSLWRMLSNLFGLPQPGVPSAGVEDAGHDRFQAHRAHRDEVISPAGRGPGAARYASGQLRLNSFSFSLDEPSDAGASGSGGALVLWGSADRRSFSGSDRGSFDDALSFSGSWTSLYLGMDQGFGEGLLAGLALSSGRGKMNYRYGAGDSQSGRYEARLKAVYPYFSAKVADGTRLWATVGFGRGDISNYRGTEEVPGTGDLRLGLAAAGMRHELSEWPMVRLSAVGDAAHARLKVVSSIRPLTGLQAKVNRLRAGLEVSGRHAAAPYLRVSARYERGETSRRKGLEAEGGVRWSAERYGAEFHARTLRLRGNSTTLRESGAGASVYFSPQSEGTGASLRVSHDWGRPGGSGTLWQDNPLSVSDAQSGSDLDSARSLNAELGYGLYSARLLGLVTPKLGWREDSAGERRLRIGAAYHANSWLAHQVGVEFGVHRRRTHSGVADYGGDLNASMSW